MSEQEAYEAYLAATDPDEAVDAWNQMAESARAEIRAAARRDLDVTVAREVLANLAAHPPGSEQAARATLRKHGVSDD